MGKTKVGNWSGNTYDAWLSVTKKDRAGYSYLDIKRSNKNLLKTYKRLTLKARACLETAPCREVRRSVEGGACPPARNGPWLQSEVLGFPNWVLGSAHGLRAPAWALGAGIEVLTPALQE